VRAFLRSIFVAFSLFGTLVATPPAHAGSILDDGSPGVSIDWSGLYVGLHGGYSWSRQDTGLSQDIDADGWLAGGHLGLQRQFDRWVVGIEASFTGGNLDGSTTIGSGAAPVNIATSLSDLLMITGRLGYAWHDRLFYIKGGYASADVDFTISTPGGVYSSNSRLDGWTAGIGFERMITRNVSFGIEYDYIDLGGKNLSFSGGGGPVTFTAVVDKYCPPPKPVSGHLDPDGIHTIMARLSFKFGDEPEHLPYK